MHINSHPLSRRRVLTGAIACGTLASPSRAFGQEFGWSRYAKIAAAITPPRFPNRIFLVTNFGATGDGQTDCTGALQHAIAACHESGGGRVLVPSGTWLTGPLVLESNVELHIAKGATLSFDTNPARYLPPVLTRWEGVELMGYAPCIYAFGAQNIAVTGEGTLDGNADNTHWWPWCSAPKFGWQEGHPNQMHDRRRLFEMAEANIPVTDRVFAEGNTLRPVFFQPYRCKNVLIEGVTLRRTPFWQIHPVLCTNVTVRGVTMNSYGPNNDGCDPESCDHVLIENCIFDTGDDCIAIKSGRNADGRRLGVPSQNIIVRNCLFKNGHGGVTIGSEISGGVRNIFVENCRMMSADLGSAIRIKSNALRGGILEHIHVRDITIDRLTHAALTIDLNYEEGANGPFKPIVRDVSLERVTSSQSDYGIDLQGLPQSEVADIVLKNCDFKNVASGNIVRNVRHLQLENVAVNGIPARY